MKRTLFFMFFILTVSRSFAQIEKFKAAYIFNFTRYVDWPEAYNGTEFIIGIYGNDDKVSSELENISRSKTVIGKSIKVTRSNNLVDLGTCNILFVCGNKTEEIKEIVEKTIDQNVLIVTDKDGTIEEGAAICFVMNSNKLAFEIKMSNAESKGLKVSNTLINLAHKKY